METQLNSSKTYNYVYSSDPSGLNYLAETVQQTNAIVINLVDGLRKMTNTVTIPIVGRGLTVSGRFDLYYKLRKDANSIPMRVKYYAPVTAQDFVTGVEICC